MIPIARKRKETVKVFGLAIVNKKNEPILFYDGEKRKISEDVDHISLAFDATDAKRLLEEAKSSHPGFAWQVMEGTAETDDKKNCLKVKF